MNQIVDRCDVGIDLHTGSDHRINLPQIRADLDDPFTRELAVAFGAPLMLHAKLRDGSMRAAATSRGATVLLYEGGEAWRFNQKAVEAGTRGVLRVLERLSMTGDGEPLDEPDAPESRSSSWVRARRTGLVQLHAKLGEYVEKGSPLITIHDSVGRRLGSTKAPTSGIVIGHTQQPLVNQGDAIVHIARLDPEPHTVTPRSRDFT
jgi:predicted deacylase